MSKVENFVINPREVKGELNYDKIEKNFEINEIDINLKRNIANLTGELHLFLRRDLVSFHRNLKLILSDYKSKKGFFLITGRGPSNNMHIGHLIPFMMAKWLQDKFKVNLYIQLADDEKFLNKTHPVDLIRKYTHKNILDIIALKFDMDRTFIFSNTDYIKNFYPLALRIAKRMDIYRVSNDLGLSGCSNPGLNFYPTFQIAPMMFENKRSLTVSGLDQDPYCKIENGIAKALNTHKSASILNRFVPSLTGMKGKMNASVPQSTLYLSDTKDSIKSKINKYLTHKSLKTNKNKYNDPFQSIAFRMLYYFLEKDDTKIEELRREYINDEIYDNELNEIFADKMIEFMEVHQNNKDKMMEFVDAYTKSGKLASEMWSKIYK